MMLPFINILGVAIAFPPLLLLLGIWIGASLAERNAQKHNLSGDRIFNLIFTTLAAYIIGGRLAYAAQNISAFSADPASLLSRNFGLFDPLSGVIIGLIAALVYAQKKQMPLWSTLDALSPFLAVLMLVLPLANLASGTAYGAPSQLPWAIELWGMTRHPVQVYEALSAGLILFYLRPRRIQSVPVPGLIFLQFAGLTALARLVFEGLRGSSPVTVYNLRISQLIAWVILAAALWGYARLIRKEPTQG